MTGPNIEWTGIKIVVAAFSILFAVAALAALSTASTSADRSASRPAAQASSLEHDPLGR